MKNIHPFKHYEYNEASELWTTLLPSFGRIKDLIDESPGSLLLMNLCGGRLLIDLTAFDAVVSRIHPYEYESMSNIDLLCDLYSEDAFRLVYALTYTGKEEDFDNDVEKMLAGRTKVDKKVDE